MPSTHTPICMLHTVSDSMSVCVRMYAYAFYEAQHLGAGASDSQRPCGCNLAGKEDLRDSEQLLPDYPARWILLHFENSWERTRQEQVGAVLLGNRSQSQVCWESLHSAWGFSFLFRSPPSESKYLHCHVKWMEEKQGRLRRVADWAGLDLWSCLLPSKFFSGLPATETSLTCVRWTWNVAWLKN